MQVVCLAELEVGDGRLLEADHCFCKRLVGDTEAVLLDEASVNLVVSGSGMLCLG